MRALIVSEGRSRAALAGARALGRAGWTVGAGEPVRHGLSGASRFVERVHRVPLPERDLPGFLGAVARAVADGRYEVVFGSGDAEILALSSGRDSLGAVVPYGPHRSLVRAIDKVELMAAAERAGLAVPRTVAATAQALGGMSGPFVVKARLHWEPGRSEAPPRLPALVLSDAGEALRRGAEIEAAGGEALVQEPVEGDLLSVTVVADGEGGIVAAGQQTARLTWPPGRGGATRAVTVPVDRELVERVGAMLRDLEWFGLAQVQFMAPPRAEPRVIDLNGRFYGSMSLAVASGPNFPDLWARLATGRPLPAITPSRPGVRFQWLEGDLRRARVERRGGLVRDVVSCVRVAPGAVHSMWSTNDPAPFLNQVRHLARLGGGKVGRKVLARGNAASANGSADGPTPL
ncbi:MAG TPA: ATP-grasp domain-containing protein [Actinomycetota bacterium]